RRGVRPLPSLSPCVPGGPRACGGGPVLPPRMAWTPRLGPGATRLHVDCRHITIPIVEPEIPAGHPLVYDPAQCGMALAVAVCLCRGPPLRIFRPTGVGAVERADPAGRHHTDCLPDYPLAHALAAPVQPGVAGAHRVPVPIHPRARLRAAFRER